MALSGVSGAQGKVALVTGAGSGIGAATAIALGAAGASVAAFDRDEASLRSTVSAIEERGGEALSLVGDTRCEAEVSKAVQVTAEAFRGIDLLAAIAGVLGELIPLAELDEAIWDTILDTNVKGPFLFSKHVIPQMRRHGGGAIVTVSSVMASTGVAGAVAYSASKAALVGLTHALGVELATDGIRVNAVAPGVVRSPMNVAVEAGEAADAVAGSHPIERLIEPDEVARLIVFLLSDDASAITGSIHRVDGGLLSRLPS